MAGRRIDWIDQVKGLGIILVVVMSAVSAADAAGGAANWLRGPAAWAEPVVVPAFFLIAGLFLHRAIFGSRSAYFDRRVLHFAYLFAVWLAIDTVVRHGAFFLASPAQLAWPYLTGWVDPPGPLWFIHALAIFCIVARLTRHLPARWVLGGTAALQVLHAAGFVETGWPVADRFAQFYVFFFAGHATAPLAFRLARAVRERSADVAAAGALWFGVHTAFVALGIADLPVVSLILGLAGTLALFAAGAGLAHLPAARPVGEAGRQSLAIYLAFPLPMQALLAVLSGTGAVPDAGAASLAAAAGAIALSLAFHAAAMRTPLRVLYVRPRMFRLRSAPSARRGTLLTSALPDA